MYPKRSDYNKSVHLTGAPVLFLPVDYFVKNDYNSCYMLIIGVDENGGKMLVKVRDLPIFVEVLTKEQVIPKELQHYPGEWIRALPGIGYSEPMWYYRIYFTKIHERKKFIEKYHEIYTLASDSRDYEFLFWAYTGIDVCGWNVISNYTINCNRGKYRNNWGLQDVEKLPNQITCTHTDISPCENPPKYDKTIVCSWDLETHTNSSYGGVPNSENLEDRIKLCAMVFRYTHSDENLLKIVISDINNNYRPNCEGVSYIISNNIPKTMAEVIAAMQPDYLTGFNDGGYDWPFINNRIASAEFVTIASSIKLSEYETTTQGALYRDKFPKMKIIKIDAETHAEYRGCMIPGCVTFDTAILLRRANKNETQWKLDFFLGLYKLPEKIKMPYDLMARIFRLWEIATPDSIDMNRVRGDHIQGKNAISHLSQSEIAEHFRETDKVVEYCVYDAEAVLDLLKKINAIMDIRTNGTLTYTSLKDGFYRANGIKICNIVNYYAFKPVWGCHAEKYPLKFSVYTKWVATPKIKEESPKYPGAYVLPPIRGIHCIRPVVGLDFESLYPNIDRAYNLSPEYYMKSQPGDLEHWTYIETTYKRESEPESPHNIYRGWFKKHESHFADGKWTYVNHGIIPTIFNTLFEVRGAMKRKMNYWKSIVEVLERDVRSDDLQHINHVLDEKIRDIKLAAEKMIGKNREFQLDKARAYEFARSNINAEWTSGFDALYENAKFNFKQYNSKQLSCKELMNSIYGEMGNAKSPFFIVALSGGITKKGQENLKDIIQFVKARDFKIYYGDTDSLYISLPESCFVELDREYAAGRLSRKLYFEEMVSATMNGLKVLACDVGEHLCRKLGCPFLKMAYEEVLFPLAFFGKKNYCGIQHMTSIDFSVPQCEGENQEFIDKLMIRGMAIRRRDGSQFVKRALGEIIIEYCRTVIETDIPLHEINFETIVHGVIEKYLNNTAMNPERYIGMLKKNYSFREPKTLNTNTASMKFRQRMIELNISQKLNRERNNVVELAKYGIILHGGEYNFDALPAYCEKNFKNPKIANVFKRVLQQPFDEDLDCLKSEIPQYGERHDLILVTKPGCVSEIGKKNKEAKAYYLEYIGMLGNRAYANYIKKYEITYKGAVVEDYTNVGINFRYYFEELFSKCARLLLYKHEQAITDNMSRYMKDDPEERIKKAEKYVIGLVKRDICRKYANYFPEIKIDVSILNSQFRDFKKKYKLNGFVMALFEKRLHEKDYTNVRMFEALMKSLVKPRLMRFKFVVCNYSVNYRRRYVIQMLKKQIMHGVDELCMCTDVYQINLQLIADLERDYKRLLVLTWIEQSVDAAVNIHKTLIAKLEVQSEMPKINPIDLEFMNFIQNL